MNDLGASAEYAEAIKVDCPFCEAKVGERCDSRGPFPQYPHTARLQAASPLHRAYEGQAHYMAKAAQSLVNMLNGLDYSKFTASDAIDLTTEIHNLISRIDYAAQDSERLSVTRPDGQVVRVTVPEREE